MASFSKDHYLDMKDRLFIAMIRLAEREKDLNFLTSDNVRHVGEYLGISSETCTIIKEKFLQKYKKEMKMNIEVTCIGCGKVVKINRYQVQKEYRCSKCRGIDIPKKSKNKKII